MEKKPNLHRGQCHHPTLHRRAAGLSPFSRVAFCIPAVQRDSANLYHLFCFPRFGLRRTALGSQRGKKKNAVAWHGSFQRAMGFTASHRQARLAAMLMRRRTAARSNGHCSTKLTVHLLLAADAGESGL